MSITIILQNAEKRALDRLHDLFFTDFHQRCLFLRLSALSPLKDGWQTDIQDSCRDVMIGEQLEIYVFADCDVLMIGRSLSFRKLDQFISHLNQKLAPASAKGLAQLFEIGADMKTLRKICTAKSSAQAEQDNNEDITDVPNIPDEFEIISESALIKSLARRRRERKGIEILVAEDDPFSQKLIQSSLSKHWDVTITADGRGAVMNYLKCAPDLMFLDIGLPDIDGHAVLKKIFAMDPDAFVVMFSGKGDRNNVLRAVEYGAKGFVGKPFAREKLFHYIEKSPFVLEKTKERSAQWKP